VKDDELRIFEEAEFRHLLSREIQRGTRYQDFVSLCLIKTAYPGAPRPEVPAAVAREIVELLRATDVIGTIGDRVAVLLVHTPDTDAATIVERIRGRVQGTTFPVPEGRVTLTIALAGFPSDGTSEEALLTHALAQLQRPTGTVGGDQGGARGI
jgi:hypothetical protein